MIIDNPEPDEYFEHYLQFASPHTPWVGDARPDKWHEWWRARWADADDAVTMLARSQGFVITTAQVEQCGMSRARLRTELRRGRWSVRRRGVVSPLAPSVTAADGPRRAHALDAAAAALLRPRHLVSGRSAAVLSGLPTLAVPDVPELTTEPDRGIGLRSGARCRDAATGPDEVTSWFGVPVHTVARTVIDLARHSRRDGIMAADAALHQRLVTADELARALARAAGWVGARQAREIVGLADGRAESPLESVTRLALIDDGFPPPELQFWIGGYRVDLCWPAQRLVLEADGRVKYRPAPGGNGDPLWQEKKREAALRRANYRVDRVIWADVLQHWPATSRRLAAQLGLASPPRPYGRS